MNDNSKLSQKRNRKAAEKNQEEDFDTIGNDLELEPGGKIQHF